MGRTDHQGLKIYMYAMANKSILTYIILSKKTVALAPAHLTPEIQTLSTVSQIVQ
jgi:hypothetical protein